jgi:hypothetical protein
VTSRIQLADRHLELLGKAYILDPRGLTNLSSISLFDEIGQHNSADAVGIIYELSKLGYVHNFEERSWSDVSHDSFDVAIFRLTPLGISYAERFFCAHRSYTLRERLEAVPRSDWIALVALIVAIVALFISGS